MHCGYGENRKEILLAEFHTIHIMKCNILLDYFFPTMATSLSKLKKKPLLKVCFQRQGITFPNVKIQCLEHNTVLIKRLFARLKQSAP